MYVHTSAAAVTRKYVQHITRVRRQQGNLAVPTCLAQRRHTWLVRCRLTPDIAIAAYAYPHHLVGQQVVRGQRSTRAVDNLRTPRIGILLANRQQFVANHAQDLLRVRQQIFQVGNALLELGELLLQFLAFERCQPPQLHVQNGLGL